MRRVEEHGFKVRRVGEHGLGGLDTDFWMRRVMEHGLDGLDTDRTDFWDS